MAELIVYGRDGCGMCDGCLDYMLYRYYMNLSVAAVRFKSELDNANIAYR